MKKTAVLLAAALSAMSPAAGQPSRSGQTTGEGPASPLSISEAVLTATLTPASNATHCPAVVAAEAIFNVDSKVEGDHSLVVRFLWSDGTNSAVPTAVVGRSPGKTVRYRVRQSRLFSSSAAGSFQVSIQSVRGHGVTASKSFTVTCALPITVAPGALPHLTPIAPPPH